jgi:DNA-directed RNA polymerase specialized sigma24 family protein
MTGQATPARRANMFRLLRAMVGWVKGWFGSQSDAMNENVHVMSATYDAAIKNREARFKTVRDAVANLIGVEQERTRQVKELGDRIATQTKIKNGAQVAMQKRLDGLKAMGKSKEDVLADGEFIKHKKAFEDASQTLAETKGRFDEKDADLTKTKREIATYKAELQSMQRANEELKSEKHEAVADVGIAKQKEAIAATIAGIPQDTADSDLDKAREARRRVVNRADLTSELAGTDAKKDENEYLNYAAQGEANKELDALLDWGDEKKTEALDPAKVPE